MRTGRLWAILVVFVALVGAGGAGLVEGTSSGFPFDPSFAANAPIPGLVRLQLDGQSAQASHVVVDSDGSLFVGLAGIGMYGYGDGRAGIAKLRSDGTLDPSFNPVGPTPGVVDLPQGLVVFAVDHHHRVVVAGTAAIERLASDGTPDPGFVMTCVAPCVPGVGPFPPIAPSGVVYVPNRVYDIAVAADDSILVASADEINMAQPFEQRLTKLTATGDRDIAFADGGVQPGELDIADPTPARLFTRPDGSWLDVAVGSLPARIRHITTAGTVDADYGTGGVAFPPVAAGQEIGWVDDDPTGQLVVELLVPYPAAPPSLARINPDATTDITFGHDGVVDLTALGAYLSDPVFVQPDRRIIVAVRQPGSEALARLTDDGRLDGSWNGGSATPGWLPLDLLGSTTPAEYLLDVATTGATLVAAAGGSALSGPVGDVFRFTAFPAAPRPMPLYPIGTPPPPIPLEAIVTAANALHPAVRIRTP